MDWKSVDIASGCKLFRVHNFNYMHQGVNFALEIDEYQDGSFTGHGENATDENYVIESVNGTSLQECLSALISRIDQRVGS